MYYNGFKLTVGCRRDVEDDRFSQFCFSSKI
jgi:hypothetical protein